MADDYATRGDLNGLGSRLNSNELLQTRHDEKIATLQREAVEQKKDVWQAIGELRDAEKNLIIKVSFIMGGISLIGIIATVCVQIFLK